jgi:hypothetical protein
MKHLIKIFFTAVVSSTLLTSCLKDKVPNDYSNIGPVVIIPNANWPTTSADTSVTSIKISSTPYEVQVYARVSWENALKNDVVVTFAKDEADVKAFNDKLGTHFLAVPDAAITATSLKATIAGNTNDSSIKVAIKLDQLDPSKKYILPYTISDASGQNIGVNYKTYLFRFSLKP